MAENTLKDGVRTVANEVRPSEINPKLEEAMQNQPLLPHLVNMRNVLMAAAIGVVVALILFILMSPMMAGVGLLIVFFGAWFGLALRDYGRADAAREERQSSEDGDTEAEDADEDDEKS
jgi:hypothetical protein